jgi:hypothetical protein
MAGIFSKAKADQEDDEAFEPFDFEFLRAAFEDDEEEPEKPARRDFSKIPDVRSKGLLGDRSPQIENDDEYELLTRNSAIRPAAQRRSDDTDLTQPDTGAPASTTYRARRSLDDSPTLGGESELARDVAERERELAFERADEEREALEEIAEIDAPSSVRDFSDIPERSDRPRILGDRSPQIESEEDIEFGLRGDERRRHTGRTIGGEEEEIIEGGFDEDDDDDGPNSSQERGVPPGIARELPRTTVSANTGPTGPQLAPPGAQVSPTLARQMSLLERYRAAKKQGDAEADQATKKANDQRWATHLGEALEGLVRSVSQARGGQGVDGGFYSGLRGTIDQREKAARDRANRGVSNLVAEEELSFADTKRNAERAKIAAEQAKIARQKDPNSTESQVARALAKQVVPTGRWDNANAFQILNAMPFIETLYKIENAKAQQAILRERTIGQQFNDAARVSNQAHKIEVDDENADLTHKLQKLRLENEIATETKKNQERDDSRRVEGAEIMKGFSPTARNVDEVRRAKKSMDKILYSLDKLDEIYKRSGTNYIGDDANEQETHMEAIGAAIRELDNLGVPNGADLKSQFAQMPDPVSATSNLKSMIGMDSHAVKSKALRDKVNAGYDATLKSYGYRRTEKKSPDGDGKSKEKPKGPSVDPSLDPRKDRSQRKPVKYQYSPSRNQTRIIYNDATIEVRDGRIGD